MDEEGEALGSFTLCIDQVFIKRDSFACREQPQSVSIVIDSREKHFESEIIDIEINTPRSLDIRHDLPYANGTQTRVDIRVFIDDIIVAHIEFSFNGNELRSYQQFEDDLFVRLIIRAFVPDPFSFKFKIFSLREFSIRDIDRESIEDIGRGSFGCVYSSEICGITERVALKCLSVPDIRDRRDSSIREVLPFITIPHHPCIVGIYGYIFNSNQFILVLEYVENRSLADFIDYYESYLTRYEKQKLIYSIVHCLGFMQSYGLIHRDMSPHNILVSSDFECKIIDFSISRFDDDSDLTKYQGNAEYMAPEIKRGDKYGKESDIYSVSKLILKTFSSEPDNAMKERWEIYRIICSNNYPSESPEERFDFNEMCVLFESIFDDATSEYISEIVEKTNYGNNPVSLKKISSLAFYLVCASSLMGSHLLDFGSELIKVCSNDPYESEFYLSCYYDLMTVGSVTHDMELMNREVTYYIHDFRYDTSRLMYRANTSLFSPNKDKSYKECCLEFDEQVGFKPAKNKLKKSHALDLAIMYHSLKIKTFQNCTRDPYIEKMILSFNIYDHYELDKYINISEKIQHSDDQFFESAFSALADVGYVNMAKIAYKFYEAQCYGYKKTMKYLMMSIDNGDQESIEHLKTHPYLQSEDLFIEHYHREKLNESLKNRDFPAALFEFLNYQRDIFIKIGFNFKEIKNYYLILAIIYINLDELEESKIYIKAACDEGSYPAKVIRDAFYINNYSGIEEIQDYDYFAAVKIAEWILDIYYTMKRGK